ncbi:MAG: putative sulfate exporter family transporter [Bacillota bacterium]|uniref:YeiH family protein n=1 Tax=Desulforudis sp. DRI-14 TaxID=3459793 RepID=UPI00347B46A7
MQVEILQHRILLRGSIQGFILAMVVGVIAHNVVSLPFFCVFGQMVIAILIGIGWRAVMGIPKHATVGINFASKRLLRYGIILMGVRLNLDAIVAAGSKVILLDAAVILLAIVVICFLGRLFAVEERLALLTAVGTGICGAAAIAAVAPTVKANEDETVVSIASVALLGTIGSVLYVLLQSFWGMDSNSYGVFAGATLHEIAHVIAATQSAGSPAANMAILTKLGRVVLLVPVTFGISLWFNFRSVKKEQISGRYNLSIPWFLIGFLGMSCLRTIGLITDELASILLQISTLFLTIAMAGMGLSVEMVMFRRMGLKSLFIGLLGSLAISIVSFGVVRTVHF